MKKLHVAPSAMTNRIYCGHLSKDKMAWASNKTDVTGEACAAVAKHVLANGHPTVITANGVPAFEITVRDLRPNVEVTGAARLYRAASVWTAGLGVASFGAGMWRRLR